jgi:hypothetical protein
MVNSYIYNPVPPRSWSRVQHPCSTNQNNTNIPNDFVYIPLTKQYVTPLDAQKLQQMMQKGNILQYKNNCGNLTKKQKYSQISRGCNSSRKKCFATQTTTYSNPNTTSFQRVNYTNIPYPNSIIGSPNNPSGPYQANAPNPFGCVTNVLQDGGNLICGTIENPCSEQVIQKQKTQPYLCFPSYCSDVPGRPIELCWYSNMQTWYPRNQTTMNNSLDKWPEGYKGFVSALTPAAPVLSIVVNTNQTQVTLSWTSKSSVCIPISSYTIYQNGALVKTVSYQFNSATISNLTPDTNYTFFVKALSGTIQSSPSNTEPVLLTN